MATLEDLVVLERRGELSSEELEQFRRAEQCSSELSLAVDVARHFDAEGQSQAGDKQAHLRLLNAIVSKLSAEQVEAISVKDQSLKLSERRLRNSGVRLNRSRLPRAWWLGAAVPLLAATAAAAAAYGGYHWLAGSAPDPVHETKQPVAVLKAASPDAEPAPESSATAIAQAVVPPIEKAEKLARAAVNEKATSRRVSREFIPADAPRSQPRPPPRSDLSTPGPKQQLSPPVERKPDSRVRLPTPGIVAAIAVVDPETAPPPEVVSPEASLPVASLPSASQLLDRARLARRGNWSVALTLYQRLINTYPRSVQAGIAEMALAKREASEGHWHDARRWFRRHQERHRSPLRAEAHWGEVTASRRLKDARALRHALKAVLRIFPNTAYGQVAQEELRALESGESRFAQ